MRVLARWMLLVLASAIAVAPGASAQAVGRIRGPSALTAAFTPFESLKPIGVPANTGQSAPGWKSAVILGAVVAVVGGVVVASMDGDTKDRTTGDRVKSGVIGGLIIAVPVTVIFAMLSGGDDG